MGKIDIYNENKIHSQGGFPFDIYICHLPKDRKEVCNHHHQQCEIIVIKSGSGIVSINLEKMFVEMGDIIFVPKNTLHAISQNANEEMSYENIIFEESVVFGNGVVGAISDLRLNIDKFPILIKNCNAIYEEVSDCIKVMDEFSELKTEGYELMIKSALAKFFYHMNLAKQGDEKRVNKSALAMIKKIMLYISEHYKEDISIKTVAREMGYSQSRFMAIFKENMGVTFTKYLSDIRLGHAMADVLQTKDKVTDISARCGFSNISYFNRLFKEKYGKSPSEIRREK